MTLNMATADRAIRITVAIVAGLLIFMGRVSGTLAIVVGVFAAVFLVTSFVGFCPLYKVLGFSTRRRAHPQPM
jgi:hypothetical protein